MDPLFSGRNWARWLLFGIVVLGLLSYTLSFRLA